MARAPSICLEHGCPHTAVRLNRCRDHAADVDRRQRATTPTKVNRESGSERRRRAAAVRAHRARHGDWCPGYKVAPHPATDLTAEHVDALAEGGADGQVLDVLCRSCNSRHGAETLNLLRHA